MKKQTKNTKGTAKKKLSKLDVQKLRKIRGGEDFTSVGAGCSALCSKMCPTAACPTEKNWIN